MSTHTHTETKANPVNDAEVARRMLWMAPAIILITIVLGYAMWKNPTHYTASEVGSVIEKILAFFLGS
jgi:hypothetical protein